MAKPFIMYSYSNKILKNLPPPSRSPIMVEVEATDILLLPANTMLLKKGDKVHPAVLGSIVTLFISKYNNPENWIQMPDTTNYTTKPLHRAEAQAILNDYVSNDTTLISKFKKFYYENKNFNW